jgi:hypothetical protein
MVAAVIAEAIIDLLEGLCLSAILEPEFVAVVHDEPARFIAYDLEHRVIWACFAQAGEVVRINRTFRLKIEPVERVRLHHPFCAAANWSVT